MVATAGRELPRASLLVRPLSVPIVLFRWIVSALWWDRSPCLVVGSSEVSASLHGFGIAGEVRPKRDGMQDVLGFLSYSCGTSA